MNSISAKTPIDLQALYKSPSVNQISGFYRHSEQLDSRDLIAAYHRVRESAPRRHQHGKRYFVGHQGVTGSGGFSNRREEHLAVALWNRCNDGDLLIVPGGKPLELLDYQFPLKGQQSDRGVGKVDLFGLIGDDTPCVIELKIHTTGNGMGDTPLRAFLEALAYCAIVEANIADIALEASKNWKKKVVEKRPDLIVMAPEEYWSAYLNHKRTGDWWPALRTLADQLEQLFGLRTHFLALRDIEFDMGLAGEKPQVSGNVSLISLTDLM